MYAIRSYYDHAELDAVETDDINLRRIMIDEQDLHRERKCGRKHEQVALTHSEITANSYNFV